MSRVAFARKHGATCRNERYAWSYVNHEKGFVLFGAWREEIQGDKQRIFSKYWQKDANNRKPKAYAEALRHIELIVEQGYELYTFLQWREPDKKGVPRVQGFETELLPKKLEIQNANFFAVDRSGDVDPPEFDVPDIYHEGESTDVHQTVYERNPAARKACIDHFGAVCQACKLDFEKRYGALANGFIHVHHLVPISSRKTTYKVDPKNDLVPVCPNCHAVIHMRRPEPFSVEEVRAMIEAQK